jgi:hypothetical protein
MKCCETLKILQTETEKIIPNHKLASDKVFTNKHHANADQGYCEANDEFKAFSWNLIFSNWSKARFGDEDLYAWGGTVDSFTGLQNSYQNSYNLSRLEIVEQGCSDAIRMADESIACRKRK